MTVRELIEKLNVLIESSQEIANHDVLLEQYDAESAETFSASASNAFAGSIKTTERDHPVVLITRGDAPTAAGFEPTPSTSIEGGLTSSVLFLESLLAEGVLGQRARLECALEGARCALAFLAASKEGK